MTVDPPSVIGGAQNATGTVQVVDTYIPPQGLQIGITAFLAGLQPQSFVVVPNKITLLPNAPSSTFPITTKAVPAIEDVEIQAWCPPTAVLDTANLQLTHLNPPGTIISVSVSPDNVNFGDQPAVGTVRIAAPLTPQSVVVSLTSSQPSAAVVPATVTVPAGQTVNSFPVTVAQRNPTRGRVAIVWISASAGGVISQCELLVGRIIVRP